jgi:hypothetical protein
MFSVITNIYNKKTKGRTLMELLTATRKIENGFYKRRLMCAPQVTRHTPNISSCKKKKFQFSCGCEQYH